MHFKIKEAYECTQEPKKTTLNSSFVPSKNQGNFFFVQKRKKQRKERGLFYGTFYHC
jgi:hypothetical protein